MKFMTKKTHKKLSALFELRSMLLKMEQDVGLDALSAMEKDVFLAAHALSETHGEAVTSDEIRKHELIVGMAQASYHRALRTLVSLGFLEKADGYKARRYVVSSDVVH